MISIDRLSVNFSRATVLVALDVLSKAISFALIGIINVAVDTSPAQAQRPISAASSGHYPLGANQGRLAAQPCLQESVSRSVARGAHGRTPLKTP
jgi:hypothetical protein